MGGLTDVRAASANDVFSARRADRITTPCLFFLAACAASGADIWAILLLTHFQYSWAPGWVEGHDQGCPYDGGKTPWFEEAIAKSTAQIEQRNAEIERLIRETRDSCPCTHTTPCHARCTCINIVSSSGCRRCCRYGSDEQQRMMAERLVLLERIAMEALHRHMVGDFERLMPASGYKLIEALKEWVARDHDNK